MSNNHRAEEIIYQRFADDQIEGDGAIGCFDVDKAVKDLADEGLLMPDLPKDNTGEMGSGEWSAGFEYPAGSNEHITELREAHAYAWAPGIIGISAPKQMSTNNALSLALALIAAVKSDREYERANRDD